MTVLQTKIGMPLEQFMEVSEAQPFELIHGKRRLRLPTVFGHSETVRKLFVTLDHFANSYNLGEAFSNTTFVVLDKSSRDWVDAAYTPDASFYIGSRIPIYESNNPDCYDRPLALVPDLVIEVVSPNDKVSELDEKIDAYLLDGVRLIWVIDPQRRKAVVYAPDMEQPLHLNINGVLDGGDVLPDFKLSLTSIFSE
jgi:Uma2 family endonuclease